MVSSEAPRKLASVLVLTISLWKEELFLTNAKYGCLETPQLCAFTSVFWSFVSSFADFSSLSFFFCGWTPCTSLEDSYGLVLVCQLFKYCFTVVHTSTTHST